MNIVCRATRHVVISTSSVGLEAWSSRCGRLSHMCKSKSCGCGRSVLKFDAPARPLCRICMGLVLLCSSCAGHLRPMLGAPGAHAGLNNTYVLAHRNGKYDKALSRYGCRQSGVTHVFLLRALCSLGPRISVEVHLFPKVPPCPQVPAPHLHEPDISSRRGGIGGAGMPCPIAWGTVLPSVSTGGLYECGCSPPCSDPRPHCRNGADRKRTAGAPQEVGAWGRGRRNLWGNDSRCRRGLSLSDTS